MAGEMRLIDVSKVINAMQKCLDESPDKKGTVTYFAFEALIECLKQEPTVDAVEVIRCAQCLYLSRNEETQKLSCGIHGHTLMELTDQSFCSAGMTEAQWLALHGDELEDGDPLKPK